MTVSANTQAILLLTAHFGKGQSGTHKPLTPKEYGRFAEWLRSRSLTPERLLTGDLIELLQGWHDKTVSVERISGLLDRGSALALSMEKWLRAGLWVMTRSDPDYPKRLKKHLRGDSPAVLFGCGNRSLLNGGGLAVVGSRKVQQPELDYSRKIGEMAASAGVSIVSGGAKGVDETAMRGALDTEGTAVGVLADSLLRASSSTKYRRALMDNNLVLVSPFNPEAGFNAGNAMQRNKYIYCLADSALAVHSGKKGGTWSGAHEDLKKAWVPLWVKVTSDPEAGNHELIEAGALEAPSNINEVDIEAFFTAKVEQPSTAQDLFATAAAQAEKPVHAQETESASRGVANDEADIELNQVASGHVSEETTDSGPETCVPKPGDLSKVTFYELFVVKTRQLCASEPRTTDELLDALALNKTQLNTWLKQAVEDGELKKLTKPVRYELGGSKQRALILE